MKPDDLFVLCSSPRIRTDWLLVNTIGSPPYTISQFLASLLKPVIRNQSVYVKNSVDLVETLDTLTLALGDIMLSLDICLLIY